MKNLKLFLIVQVSLFTFHHTFSQDITTDTILANQYFDAAKNCFNSQNYDSATFYLNKAQPLYIKHLGEKSLKNAKIIYLSGIIANYEYKFDKALDYFFLCLAIRKELLGEQHDLVADLYNALGIIYSNKAEYKKSLEYHSKSLALRKELLGEKHINVAASLFNIGVLYRNTNELDSALVYNLQCMEIYKEKLGDKNAFLAGVYLNIGLIYSDKLEYEKALEYEFKSLAINKALLNAKNTGLALSYFNVGRIYQEKKEYSNALIYFQKAMVSCFLNFNDTVNVHTVPTMANYLNHQDLLIRILWLKAVIYDMSNVEPRREVALQIALRHYLAADTLIDIRNKGISETNKLMFGEIAHHIYRGITKIYTILAENKELSPQKAQEYKQKAFYYSEKRKSPVLRQILIEMEALKSGEIPDSMLQKVQKLKTDIAFYTKQLAVSKSLDSIKTTRFRMQLFSANRSYDSLILAFEKQYPKYFDLKYNNIATIETLQNTALKDGKTAIVYYSYSDVSEGDSILSIFTITNKTFDVKNLLLTKTSNGSDPLEYFNKICSTGKNLLADYNKFAYSMYNVYFPKNINKHVKNLIIIPDLMPPFPFEALLTEKVADNIPFKDLPFLIRDYNISYSYSATLLEHTISNVKHLQNLSQQENNWIGIAPVFDGENKKAVTSENLMAQLRKMNKKNTLNGEVLLINGDSIPPLPASEDEVREIYSQYNQLRYNSKIALRENANEQFIKSGGLENYKILHFATHAFANCVEPELSGVLLAQDSTGGQDGILFSDEIKDLKLYSDLVVLSACETGLGRQYNGEGMLGLARSFLYAGARNIIVSFWSVNDKSTADLMIDFYKGILTKRKNQNYSQALRKAKLKMIDEGKFSHPFYWSPFILIGK